MSSRLTKEFYIRWWSWDCRGVWYAGYYQDYRADDK